jgi:LmbE family N-acetylglucosaminyl deacetylase
VGSLEQQVRLKDTVAGTLESIQKQLVAKQTEIESLDKQLTDKKVQVGSLEQQVKLKDKATVSLNSIKKQLAAKQIEAQILDKQLADKKAQVGSLEQQVKLKNTVATNIEVTQKQLSYLKQQQASIEMQMETKQKEEAAINSQLVAQKLETEKLAQQIKLKNSITSQLVNLQAQLTNKQKEAAIIGKQYIANSLSLAEVNGKLKNANSQLSLTKMSMKGTSSKTRKVDIFYSPHPDDEVLSMGMAIAESIKNGDEVQVVLLTHGYDTNAINILNGEEYCKWHHKKHDPTKEGYKKFTKQDIGNARVKEFITSVEDLGVEKSNIHICNFDEDSVTAYEIKLVMLGFENQYPGAYHNTTSYYDAHPFHKKLGETLLSLYENRQVKNAEFYISPVQWSSVQGSLLTDSSLKNKVLKSLDDYKVWDPQKDDFGVGYHSYPEPFNSNLKQLSSKYHFASSNNMVLKQ